MILALELPPQKHLYLYNKYHTRFTDDNIPNLSERLPFYFFGSSSSGNSVYLKRLNTLIDLGFPYKKYKEVSINFFLYIKYVFLTHEHNDHLNPATLVKILQEYPNVKIVISDRMYDMITSNQFTHHFANQNQQDAVREKQKRFLIFNQNTAYLKLHTINGTEFYVIPHYVTHGKIMNIAYEIYCKALGIHTLYSSDIDSLFPKQGYTELPVNIIQTPEGNKLEPLKHPFNVMFLEANYDKNVLDKVLKADPTNYRALQNKRHISEQESWQYVKYSLAPNGIFIPLHASKDFGTLIQNLQTT